LVQQRIGFGYGEVLGRLLVEKRKHGLLRFSGGYMQAYARRTLLCGAFGSVLFWAGADAADEGAAEQELVQRLVGGPAVPSPLVHVQIPPVFGNGYSVPLTLIVDSPMTTADHVRTIHLFAPGNPIIPVANFRFTPQSGRAAIATRIRLAKSQTVIAVAEMSDGSRLMGRAFVKVDIDGCA